MSLYEFIPKRKSVRNYNNKRIDELTMLRIRDFISDIKPLSESIKIKFNIIESDGYIKSFKGNFKAINAPYYIFITSEDKEGYLENAGFMGEQIVLYLTSLGLGTCWLGGMKPKKTFAELQYVLSIAFGYENEKVQKSNIRNVYRKSVEQICIKDPTDDFMKKVVEYVRLAPSGINRQPWLLEPYKDKINVYCENESFLTHVKFKGVNLILPGVAFKKMQYIDCGIALTHIYIYAIGNNKEVEIKKIKNVTTNRKKLIYIDTVLIS